MGKGGAVRPVGYRDVFGIVFCTAVFCFKEVAGIGIHAMFFFAIDIAYPPLRPRFEIACNIGTNR